MHTVFVMASPRTGLRIFQLYSGERRIREKKKERDREREKRKEKRTSERAICEGIVHDADTGVTNSRIDKNRNDLFPIICQGSLRSLAKVSPAK